MANYLGNMSCTGTLSVAGTLTALNDANITGDLTVGLGSISTVQGTISEGTNRVFSLGNKVPIPTGLSATGTANNTTYLRGDGTWATIAGQAAVVASQPQMLSLYQTTGQTIPNVTDTIVTWDSTDQNQGMTGVTYSSSTGAFTVVETGVYYIAASLRYAANAAPVGERYVAIGPAGVGGAGYNTATPTPAGNRYGQQGSTTSSTIAAQNINASASRYLVAGETFAIWTYQSQGTSLTLDTSFKSVHVNITKLSGAKGDTGASGTGANGEVVGYNGPPTATTVSGTNVTTISAGSYTSIAGHKYKITAYLTGDTDATAGSVAISFDLPNQANPKYLIYLPNSTTAQFVYGGASGEYTETSTQTRTASVTIIRSAGSFTVRAGSAMINVEDITPGSSLIVAPSSNAPAQNVVVAQVRSSANYPLTTTATTVPGCSYTLPVSGTYLVTFVCDYSWAVGDGALVGYLTLDGVAPTINPQAVLAPSTNVLRTDCTISTVITGSAGQVLTLVASKQSGTAGSLVNAGHTGFSVALPGTGNLDSDVLNLMGAL